MHRSRRGSFLLLDCWPEKAGVQEPRALSSIRHKFKTNSQQKCSQKSGVTLYVWGMMLLFVVSQQCQQTGLSPRTCVVPICLLSVWDSHLLGCILLGST
mmetsp:Transcript_8903/g.20224  ORF Transcript_8903/g.20224 Transcript_8903/m.20224 type:complete len:99 (-) Transcript_8903:56-352(-)